MISDNVWAWLRSSQAPWASMFMIRRIIVSLYAGKGEALNLSDRRVHSFLLKCFHFGNSWLRFHFYLGKLVKVRLMLIPRVCAGGPHAFSRQSWCRSRHHTVPTPPAKRAPVACLSLRNPRKSAVVTVAPAFTSTPASMRASRSITKSTSVPSLSRK